ncbi:TfoX/Sxy family protein [Devosia sp.]|uniref:TfoX/Sxy family protein n=1 Tax=Devosia sp. TaxID=1871048 RepID=UPI001ACBE4EE|nr:TfoX/Sxy family protein [Devosia sp.]MBN9335147.1 TfoX/Sxy family protein [Devosia sp.]
MSMASEELVDRIRDLLPPRIHCIEKKMFGGVAFMHRGNMLVAPLKDGSMLARVGKDGMDDALALSGVSTMNMGERSMTGFVVVSGDAIEDDDDLRTWLDRCLAFVETLPQK